jgi:hypothetical protein
MGEARSRHAAMGLEPCRCDSGRLAEACCWTPQGWHKAPITLKLDATGLLGSHSRCYLRHLNMCSNKLSGEHTISAVVLREIGEENLRLGGAPWLDEGEERKIGINSLVTKRLCSAHNSALSPLDAEAGRFYRVLTQGADETLRRKHVTYFPVMILNAGCSRRLLG